MNAPRTNQPGRRTFYAGGTYIHISTDDVADMAAKFWNADLVEYMPGKIWPHEYVDTMISHAANAALWADSYHMEDTEGTGELGSEIDEFRAGWTPDYEDSLPADVLAELTSDVKGFVRLAWAYLSADKIDASQAGHDFHLTRNHHGTGFWDRGTEHGSELSDLAQSFGGFALDVAGHGYDDDACDVCGEPIRRLIGPVQDPSEEYVHTEPVSGTAHHPSGPIRVIGSYS